VTHSWHRIEIGQIRNDLNVKLLMARSCISGERNMRVKTISQHLGETSWLPITHTIMYEHYPITKNLISLVSSKSVYWVLVTKIGLKIIKLITTSMLKITDMI
jgi:hypothetical protein